MDLLNRSSFRDEDRSALPLGDAAESLELSVSKSTLEKV